MNENNTTQWLRYLLYVGIAAMANSLLGIFLPGKLSTWIGYAISAAAVYLFFRLIVSNARYKTALIFSGAALIINLLGIQALGLAGSICALVGQYQEYHAHGELIQEQDPRLAGKWGRLFWFQFGVEVIVILLTSVFLGVLVAAGSLDAAMVTALATIVAAILTLALKVLYLVYLKKTIRLLEADVLVE